jgi:hypothetical protein
MEMRVMKTNAVKTYLPWAAMLAFSMLATNPAFATGATGVDGVTVPTNIDGPFMNFLGMLIGWCTGAAGKSVAILAFIVGIVAGIGKGSIMGFLIGVGMSVVLAFGPNVIIGIFGATLPPGFSLEPVVTLAQTLPAVCPIV